MQNIRQFMQNYFNSFIYSLGITFGTYISIEELHKFNDQGKFFIFTGLIFLILFLENFIAVLKRSKEVEINFDISDEVNELWHFFYKFLMPFLYYLSLVAFSYYNLVNSSVNIILLLTFITFLLLFINTRAFFQNIKFLESRTHYVYDLIKFLIFFTVTNFLAHMQLENKSLLIISSIIAGLIAFLLIILMVWRINKVRLSAFVYTLLASTFLGSTFGILNYSNLFSPMQVALGLIFAFYLSVAIIHHALLNTLTRSVIIEYLVILVVIFSVIYGIS